MIKVINGKIDGFIGENKIYIGRENKTYGLKESPLANHFIIGEDGSRNRVIDKYKGWLRSELLSNTKTDVIEEIERLTELAKQSDLILTCWCKPLKCHGDFIKGLIEERLKDNDYYK